ncbi:hypothetical protein F862_gp100 [Vibrio phage vB_VpaS_MAR10]|uniref:Uncharacterized protein n=1 Tax=Vibrio phage vB_VpaS_MAR10 TaxID=1229755 RepID=K7RFS5_9CAUD|nr:hypothetical protein F862_gp100 [Vibrio phage vB_VpaS_MAR10]AFV81332.1 hypothetical protein MAR10_097 [Vibrio phage vB_VpaS_MAR10]
MKTRNKPQSTRFFEGVRDLDTLITRSTHSGEFSKKVIRLGFTHLNGQVLEGCPVAISGELFDAIGGMVYGNGGDLNKRYRLEMVYTHGGEYHLFVKYQHIIGSRRVCAISPDSVQRWIDTQPKHG